MEPKETAVKFAIDWWKDRHTQGYFPTMTQHLDWRLYPEVSPMLMDFGQPKADDIALEIGCGYGQWMYPLSRIVRHIDGFDIHESLKAKFDERFAHTVPHACMRVGDGTTIPFGVDHVPGYSLVYSISVFQHMPRAIVESYIREAARVMTKTGRAVFHFRHADNDGPYSEDIVAGHTGDWSVGWTSAEAQAVCAAAGLRVVRETTGGNSLLIRAEF